MKYLFRPAAPILMLATIGLLLAGCPRPGAIEIFDPQISTVAPERGEEVTLTWNVRNSNAFVSQNIRFLVPTLLGIRASDTIELGGGDRSFTFTYERPATLVLTVNSSNAQSIGSDRLLIDLNDAGEAFFRATLIQEPQPGLPNFGIDPAEGQREVVFPCIGAWFELPNDIDEPGIIDGLRGFLPENGSVFRQRNFLLNPDSLVREPGGIRYPPVLGGGGARANAMIFGGAIAYVGVPVPLKIGDEGEGTAQRMPGLFPGPINDIYMLISSKVDLLEDGVDEENEVVEIELGNITQGLTLTTFGGVIENLLPVSDPRFVSSGDITFQADSGRAFGNIKQGKAGAPVAARTDGFVDYVSVEFSMPLVFDDELFTIFGTDLLGAPPVD